MFIQDPGSDFFHPGSRVDKIPDLDLYQRVKVFLTPKTDQKFSKLRSGMFIPDPWSGFFPSRILDPGFKKHRIPDPDPQHWYLIILLRIFF
jgi:hypothetical protein